MKCLCITSDGWEDVSVVIAEVGPAAQQLDSISDLKLKRTVIVGARNTTWRFF
jgi:hypothetical protein